MPTTVTMLQSRRGEDGSPWLVGQSYSASDAFAALLITANYATGTLPTDQDLVPLFGQTDSAGQVSALVSGGGKVLVSRVGIRSVGGPLRYLGVGDSFIVRSTLFNAISSASVSGGVMTINTSAAHGLGVGMLASVMGAALPAQRVYGKPVLSVPSTTSLTIAAPGAPAGAVATLPACRAGMAVLKDGQYDEQGLFVHLQRGSNYGFSMVRNSGISGATVVEIVSLWDELVTPFLPATDMVVFQALYNSIALDEPVDEVIAACRTAIAKCAGVPIIILAPAPVVTSSGANTAARKEAALQIYWRLQALCEASHNAYFVDCFASNVTTSTGLAKSNRIQGGADNTHPTPKLSWLVAQQILALIPASARPSRVGVASALDAVDVTATNPNIARNGLGSVTTGGTNSGFTASAPADETTGTGGVMGNFTASATGATGNAFWKPSDVAGNVQCMRVVASAANDQGRVSLNFTASDVALGGMLDVQFRLKLRTDFNASNKSPAAQNVLGVTAQAVLTIDATPYTFLLWQLATNITAADYIDGDFDCVVAGRVYVPTGTTLSAARVDGIVRHGAAGSSQLELSQVSARKVS